MGDLKLYGSNKNEIDSLVRIAEDVTKDIGMKFDIDRCGVLTMKRGREVECEGIELRNGEEIWRRRLEKEGISTLVLWRKRIYLKKR